jgi:hypothetical protein
MSNIDLAYRFRLHYTTSTIFANIPPNMGQQTSIPITNQQSFFHILTLPEELFNMIVSFIDSESQLALAHTCRIVYNYHRNKCRKVVAFLYSPLIRTNYKVLERWLGETGWAAVKITLKEISTISQCKNKHPIRALRLDEKLQFSDELNCESINALLLEFSSPASSTLLTTSFWEKFSNLNIVRFSRIVIDENIVTVFSKLSFLKVISLSYCEIADNCDSKIFEACTAIEEIELLFNLYAISLALPESHIEKFFKYDHIDISCCTQLRSL